MRLILPDLAGKDITQIGKVFDSELRWVKPENFVRASEATPSYQVSLDAAGRAAMPVTDATSA
jgi:hypothetical protein